MLNRNKTQITKRLPKFIFAITALLFSIFPHNLPASPTIAICQIVEHPALDMNLKGILSELKKRGYTKEEGTEIIIENAQGNASLLGQISQRLASEDADVYIAIGTQAAQSLASALKSAKRPLVFSTVTDPVDAKLVKDPKAPKGHITGVSNATDLIKQFQFFREMVPGLKRLGVIYNPGEANSVVSLKWMEKAAKEMDMTIVPAPATKTSEVNGAAKSLIGQVDAFFVDNDNTALAAFENIVKVGIENNIPAFVSDTDMVPRGALGALGPNQFELGKKAGEMAAQLIEGQPPSEIPVYYPEELDKIINEEMHQKHFSE